MCVCVYVYMCVCGTAHVFAFNFFYMKTSMFALSFYLFYFTDRSLAMFAYARVIDGVSQPLFLTLLHASSISRPLPLPLFANACSDPWCVIWLLSHYLRCSRTLLALWTAVMCLSLFRRVCVCACMYVCPGRRMFLSPSAVSALLARGPTASRTSPYLCVRHAQEQKGGAGTSSRAHHLFQSMGTGTVVWETKRSEMREVLVHVQRRVQDGC